MTVRVSYFHSHARASPKVIFFHASFPAFHYLACYLKSDVCQQDKQTCFSFRPFALFP